mgnify:FL=1
MKNKNLKHIVIDKLTAFAAMYAQAMNSYGEVLLRSRGMAGA